MKKPISISHPKIAKEFDLIKNSPLKPDNTTYGSKKKVWWICDKGHSWKAPFVDRQKTQCPYCSGHRVSGLNSLAKLFPKIAKEFDSRKNHPITPKDIHAHSNKKYWWKCKLGHSYQTTADERTRKSAGLGCPYCSGHRVSDLNSLAKLFPKVAKLYNQNKNKIDISQISFGSTKKVWWTCDENHSYQRRVQDQTARFRKNLNFCTICFPSKNGKY